ncbi:MAG: glycosyltransferase family 4 protein [bacterium]
MNQKKGCCLQKKPNQPKKIHIAVLGLRGIPDIQGGVEKHCQELYPRLVKNNFDVTIIARNCYVGPHPYECKGIQVLPIWAPRKKSLEAICNTAAGLAWLALHRKEYDVLHVHAIGPSLLIPFAKLLGFPVVVTNHGADYLRKKWGKVARIMLRLGEYLGTKHSNSIIAVSRHIKKLLSKKYKTHSIYIPNGVNIPIFQSAGQKLKSFNLEPQRYFLAVGRLVPEKGFHDLLEAYTKLETDWKLALVGEADHEDTYSKELKKQAQEINGVVMTGFQKGKALAELFSNAGLFILPSYHEGLPIVALEAMSYNLPMLISDIPANKEVALPEEIFTVGDIKALTGRLKKFLENPIFLRSQELLAKKRKRLETEFNWDCIAQEVGKIYSSLAKNSNNK